MDNNQAKEKPETIKELKVLKNISIKENVISQISNAIVTLFYLKEICSDIRKLE